MSISSWRLVPVAALLLVASVPHVSAQVRLTPGQVVGGEVVVKVYVTLSDDETPYYPVGRHRLIIFGPQRDSTVASTDEAGVATVRLPAGDYRLVSASPVEWKSARYSWNLPLTVRPGMDVVDLTAGNAVAAITAVAAGPTRAAASSSAASVQAPGRGGTTSKLADRGGVQPQFYKDPTTATLLSFLITGAGQMYAGETGKGVMLLTVSYGAIIGGAVISANSCSDYDGTCDSGPLAAGAIMAVTLWVYSMVDAGPAAHRHNARLAAAQAAPRVLPVLGLAPKGDARAGLRIELR
ncbi:MAG TPA: hypothetical protein VFS05_05335 [Gemmatimonadaceae bacterium]|nr:hypothetical protein [Gemmatimonadaceae bacterium]